MDANCVFCKIVKGSVDANIVFEDETTLAFLDQYPLARGHTLVIFKEHIARLEDIESKIAEDLFRTVYKALFRKLLILQLV